MKKIYLILLLILPLISQAQVAESLIVSTVTKDSVSGLSKEERASRTIFKSSIARKQALYALKKNYDGFLAEKKTIPLEQSFLNTLENDANNSAYQNLIGQKIKNILI